MTKVDENVRIYGGVDDTLWLGPLGTTLPTTLGAPGAGFEDVGYFGESGIDKAREQSVSKFRAHQGGKVVRNKVTESGESITFRTIEENGVTTALGETIVSETVAVGVRTRKMSTASEVKVRAGVLDLFDGTKQIRRVYPRLEITGGGNVTWSKDNLVEREFTAEIIGDYFELEVDPAA